MTPEPSAASRHAGPVAAPVADRRRAADGPVRVQM